MSKVLGALVGLVAAALYAGAAAELLRAQAGVDLLAPLRAAAPESVAGWIARAPFAGPEDAPGWRAIVMDIAVGAGGFGGLLLLAGSRLSATLLWLGFLLLAGVLVGQDLIVAHGAVGVWERPESIAAAAVLAPALLFALIAQAATAPEPEPPGAETDLKEKVEHVRELLRQTPPPAPAPAPAAEPEPAPAPRWPAPAGAAAAAEPPPAPKPDPKPAPAPEPPAPAPSPAAKAEAAAEAPVRSPAAEPPLRPAPAFHDDLDDDLPPPRGKA